MITYVYRGKENFMKERANFTHVFFSLALIKILTIVENGLPRTSVNDHQTNNSACLTGFSVIEGPQNFHLLARESSE